MPLLGVRPIVVGYFNNSSCCPLCFNAVVSDVHVLRVVRIDRDIVRENKLHALPVHRFSSLVQKIQRWWIFLWGRAGFMGFALGRRPFWGEL